MKIIEPEVPPVRHFDFPVVIFTASRARNKWTIAGMCLMYVVFMYATIVITNADRYGKGLDHFLVRHRWLYYVLIAALVFVSLMPTLFPRVLSDGKILITADKVLVSQRGAKPFQMDVSKKDIQRVSVTVPNKYSRFGSLFSSSLLLEDGRKIEFDLVSSSVKNKQGIRLSSILEAAFESTGEKGFEAS